MKYPEPLRHYLITALWSSGEEFDTFDVQDFTPAAIAQAEIDCREFMTKAGITDTDLQTWGKDLSDIGHDFWLTRNRHGAGFWDGDYPANVGQRLTAIAQTFPEQTLYLTDNMVGIE